MELVLVLTVRNFQVLLINLSQVVQIERALHVDALVDVKELPAFNF